MAQSVINYLVFLLAIPPGWLATIQLLEYRQQKRAGSLPPLSLGTPLGYRFRTSVIGGLLVVGYGM